jgi:hypothetical protein
MTPTEWFASSVSWLTEIGVANSTRTGLTWHQQELVNMLQYRTNRFIVHTPR